jgi:magnesium and cobalt transporter
MNDKPPSTSGTGGTTLMARIRRALKGDPWSREEIQDFIQQSEIDLDADEKSMLSGVLEVSKTQVRDVMVPRSHMVVIDINQKFDEILSVIIQSGHSRFPVIGEDRDEVLGILLAKDLLRYFRSDDTDTVPLRKLLRPAVLIPESKRLNALLNEFRASHNHMAIVVDEYGGVAGMVTIEDVLEQIVGDIADEHDIEEGSFIRRRSETVYIIKALTPVEDFNAYFGTGFSDDEFDTIGGLVTHAFGRLPKRGETVTLSQLRFKVLRADSRRVQLLELSVSAKKAQTDRAAFA